MQPRSEAQRAAWKRLTPNQRRLLMSDRPDEFERESALSQEMFAALEEAFGPRRWPTSTAIASEPDSEPSEYQKKDRGYAMSITEMAEEMGLSRERVSQILEGALVAFVRQLRLLDDVMSDEHACAGVLAYRCARSRRFRPQSTPDEINDAIIKAYVAAAGG